MTKIHPTAIISAKAELDSSVEIGPFCTVGPNVKMGANCKLMSHVVVDGYTTMGQNNTVFPFAVLGMIAQHKRSNAPDATLTIGDDNTFREHVTAHVGSEVDNKKTIIGNRNLFLAASHIAHDCILQDDIVMSNNATLAGHVIVGNKVTIGGLSAVLQFTRIGDGAMIGGMCGVLRDVVPYGLVMGGSRTGLSGLNLIGMQRQGIEKSEIFVIQKAFKMLFDKDAGSFADRIASVANNAELMAHSIIKQQVEFLLNPSKNNILQVD